MSAKKKTLANKFSIILSVSHVYVLSLVAEFPRFRKEFTEKALVDGFSKFIDTTLEDPFANELRYLCDQGYMIAERIPGSVGGKSHFNRYSITEKGSNAIKRAFTSYTIIVNQLGKIE